MNNEAVLVRVSIVMNDGKETQQGFLCRKEAEEYREMWQGSKNVREVKWIDSAASHQADVTSNTRP